MLMQQGWLHGQTLFGVPWDWRQARFFTQSSRVSSSVFCPFTEFVRLRRTHSIENTFFKEHILHDVKRDNNDIGKRDLVSRFSFPLQSMCWPQTLEALETKKRKNPFFFPFTEYVLAANPGGTGDADIAGSDEKWREKGPESINSEKCSI